MFAELAECFGGLFRHVRLPPMRWRGFRLPTLTPCGAGPVAAFFLLNRSRYGRSGIPSLRRSVVQISERRRILAGLLIRQGAEWDPLDPLPPLGRDYRAPRAVARPGEAARQAFQL